MYGGDHRAHLDGAWNRRIFDAHVSLGSRRGAVNRNASADDRSAAVGVPGRIAQNGPIVED